MYRGSLGWSHHLHIRELVLRQKQVMSALGRRGQLVLLFQRDQPVSLRRIQHQHGVFGIESCVEGAQRVILPSGHAVDGRVLEVRGAEKDTLVQILG